ncbi:MAG: hypothetical protein MJ169_04120 [Treponema sp.]|nr:hypothetical protein [Treponema sp.]
MIPIANKKTDETKGRAVKVSLRLVLSVFGCLLVADKKNTIASRITHNDTIRTGNLYTTKSVKTSIG